MTTLAHAWGPDGGPGPWILFLPLMWALAVGGAVAALRRTARRGRGPWRQAPAGLGEQMPITLLGRRFAAGEIDEEEYWRRLSVLEERFGRLREGGGA
ncbi:SHOCT domain-containing protein [Streptomyces sp. B1866]|uniref:SHOCT domain-containing protein n=1 Tax=Streptomyces sp. B1866 TaxID=3075431 RepID=UPI00288DD255|nr:SHOCT domain-containing protein [Streptomyces sp. B1866]MDT3398825.1 SHOCT domain-containing protein [Streptomyces sp. B1866]